jgi:hypothetical protein
MVGVRARLKVEAGTQFLPLKLGLIGFVFPESEGVLGFHNPLLNRRLISFWLFGNWVCFAKKWADL